MSSKTFGYSNINSSYNENTTNNNIDFSSWKLSMEKTLNKTYSNINNISNNNNNKLNNASFNKINTDYDYGNSSVYRSKFHSIASRCDCIGVCYLKSSYNPNSNNLLSSKKTNLNISIDSIEKPFSTTNESKMSPNQSAFQSQSPSILFNNNYDAQSNNISTSNFNPAMEARLASIDKDIDRYKVIIESTINNRITESERKNISLIDEFRGELQTREQEQRKTLKNEITFMRAEIQTKVEEMLLRIRDSDIVYSQMKSLAGSTATKSDIEAVKNEIEQRISLITSKFDGLSNNLLSEIDVRNNKTVSLIEISSKDINERLYNNSFKIDELHSKLGGCASKLDLERHHDTIASKLLTNEQNVKEELLAIQNSVFDSLRDMKSIETNNSSYAKIFLYIFYLK